MTNSSKQNRWLLSIALIVVTIIGAIALILTNRAPNERVVLQAVRDGSDGAIVAWYDKPGIHMQRISNKGNLLWTEEIVLENTKLTQPGHFTVVSDGTGGAIVTWGDLPSLPDDSKDPAYFNAVPVYSQRVSPEGELLWSKGIPTGASERHGLALDLPRVAPDGSGGIFILWNDFKTAYKALHDDYWRLQKLDAQGKPVWGENGILLFSSLPYHPTTPEEKEKGEKGTVTRLLPIWTDGYIVSDGSGGVVAVWEVETQHRYSSIYAQRYDASGQPLWQEGGVLIYSAWDASVQVTGDGNGEVIIIIGAGEPEYTGSTTYSVQRINPEGMLLWQDAGVVIKTGLQLWGNIEVMTQGSDVILLWQEAVGKVEIINGRPLRQIALNAERLSSEGITVWQGFPVFISEASESFGDLVTDNSDEGVLLAWRSGGREQWEGKVFALKINADNGKLAWEEKGITVFGAEFRYQGNPAIINDGSGGAIILAVTGKSPIGGNMVYAQRLDASGKIMWGDGIKLSP